MQDRFERFVVSITELHRYLQKLKELEMGQMDLKAGYTMCLYYLGKHPKGLTATQLTELCKERQGRHLPYLKPVEFQGAGVLRAAGT